MYMYSILIVLITLVYSFRFFFWFCCFYCFFFFFQAEDGIRDGRVTGVQTCALPILKNAMLSLTSRISHSITPPLANNAGNDSMAFFIRLARVSSKGKLCVAQIAQIGRASCRERV